MFSTFYATKPQSLHIYSLIGSKLFLYLLILPLNTHFRYNIHDILNNEAHVTISTILIKIIGTWLKLVADPYFSKSIIIVTWRKKNCDVTEKLVQILFYFQNTWYWLTAPCIITGAFPLHPSSPSLPITMNNDNPFVVPIVSETPGTLPRNWVILTAIYWK